MELTIKQAAEKAGKTEATIRNWLKDGKIKAHKEGMSWKLDEASLESYLAGNASNNSGRQSSPEIAITDEVISRIAAKVVAEIKPMLQNKNGCQEPEMEVLRKENESLRARITGLETEMEGLQEAINALAAKLQAGPQSQPGQKANEEASSKKEAREQEVDEERAEKWVRGHIAEWIDKPCPFRRATERTWRELASNTGDRIAMNGRGKQSPRAYLHAIEGWKECNAWARLKAKVALEVGKNGSTTNHYSHLVEIGG